MQMLKIDSNLTTIRMLDAICRHDGQSIFAERRFCGESRFAAIESCAQLCALHVRFCHDFRRHAFLLAITALEPLPPKNLNGMGRFAAHLKGVTQQVCTYEVEMRLEKIPAIEVALTIGTKAYDHDFREERLRPHYQQLFATLNN